MNRFVLLLILSILVSCSKGPEMITVNSPDGTVQILILCDDGQAEYSVLADGKNIILPSKVGFSIKDQPDLNDSLEITETISASYNETWKPVCGSSSEIRNNYNESSVLFTEKGGLKPSFTIIARAYNDGIAFRYVFNESRNNDSLFIMSENTTFSFPANDSAWWIPQDEFAYESLYRNTVLSEIPAANTPITVKTGSGFYISLHEAALLDYSEMTLKKESGDSLVFRSSLWPWPDSVCVRLKPPFKTPWRTIMISRNAGGLIESHMIQNLNEPCAIDDVSWIKPMKFVGIWWGMHTGNYTWYAGENHGATTERTKKYIDFAASHNIGGVLAEGWNTGWETWKPGVIPVQDFCKAYPDFDLGEVVRYAKEKGVEFISHHETGGNIPEYERQMDSAFALCNKLGIVAVKTGYAGKIIPSGMHHHGQYMVRHFQKVVELAARYKVSLDVHESIKPTGLDRTWPNLLTQEAARGNEWNATYKATPPYHSAILPFTRFLAGPYDNTPGIFNINHSPGKNKRLYCTRAHQIAMYVVFYSPLMMVSDMIENYDSPDFHFIEKVPCTWDETKVVEAVPGKVVTVARRKGENWYVGSLGDENCHLVKIPLGFLEKGKDYTATVYGDAFDTDWKNNPDKTEISSFVVRSSDTIYAAISKAGGNAISIVTGSDKTALLLCREFNSSSLLKMKVFEKLGTYGNIKTEHKAKNKEVKLEFRYSDNYPASGNNALTDGVKGMLNYSSGNWQGYKGSDMFATIDLGKYTDLSKISCSFLSDPDAWIFLPVSVEFFISENGKDFISVGKLNTAGGKNSASGIPEIKEYKVSFADKKVKVIKVKAVSVKKCPPWHYASGNEAWLFCDEIIAE